MDSNQYPINSNFDFLKVALKDRKSELKRIGLERLLSAVYQRELVLSQLMEEIGIEKNRAEYLKLRFFPVIVENLISHIKESVCRVEFGKRRFDIIERYYGLDGNMPAKLSSLGTKHGVTRERIRQLKERCLVQLRADESIQYIEGNLRLSALHLGQVYKDTTANEEEREDNTIRLSNHRTMSMIGAIESHLTKAQQNAFYGLTSSNRVKISGVPGSGKSLLAILLALKLARKGKRVLFTCYNKALAIYLESVFSHHPNVIVASYHALCLRMGTKAGIPIPGGWNNSVWEKKFPQVLEKAVLKSPQLKFDAIIVDDAQDFKTNWWTSLEACLNYSDLSGLYYFMDDNSLFYDKAIFQPDVNLSYHLSENVRTPKKIFPFVSSGYISKNGIKARTNNGEIPEFFHCDSQDEVRLTISHLFDELTTSGGMKAQDICVLTPRLTKHSNAYGASTKNCGRLVVRYSQTSNHSILSRVETFKGLERRCVILVDLDESFAGLEPEERLKCLYLAASRSTEKIVMIGNNAGWEAIKQMIPLPAYSHTNFMSIPDNINNRYGEGRQSS